MLCRLERMLHCAKETSLPSNLSVLMKRKRNLKPDSMLSRNFYQFHIFTEEAQRL